MESRELLGICPDQLVKAKPVSNVLHADVFYEVRLDGLAGVGEKVLLIK